MVAGRARYNGWVGAAECLRFFRFSRNVRRMKRLARTLVLACLTMVLGLVAAPSTHAFEFGSRRLEVSGLLDLKAGLKLAQDLIRLNESDDNPIYLVITATGGTAQGVMIVADTIKALQAPVVAVVASPVQGAGAVLPLFTDRLVMLPSASLVFTDIDYEGVAKPEEPKADAKPDPAAKAPSKQTVFLQKVRADYLDQFWAGVAKRLGERPADLKAAIDAGGKQLSAQDALAKKVAFEVVTQLTTAHIPTEKLETKVTTVRATVRTVEPAPTRP